MFSCPDDMTSEQSRDCCRIRKQSPRSCDPCCVAEAIEDVTLIITPPISRSDILLNSDTLETKFSHCVTSEMERLESPASLETAS